MGEICMKETEQGQGGRRGSENRRRGYVGLRIQRRQRNGRQSVRVEVRVRRGRILEAEGAESS